MREIKFRFWDDKCKKMLLNNGDCFTQTNKDIYINGDGNIYIEFQDIRSIKYIISAQDFIPMQFTGLHDCEGKEIYEGDILQYTFRPDDILFIVKFTQGAFEAVDREDINKNYENSLLSDENEHCKIIGNIYENPELLGEDND